MLSFLKETLAELKKKYKKVSSDECEPAWNAQFKSSAKICSHAYWKGNCKTRTLGQDCEVGFQIISTYIDTDNSLTMMITFKSSEDIWRDKAKK